VSAVAAALGTLAAITLAGWLIGRLRVLGDDAAPVLARITFTVAIPALLVSTIARSDLHVLFSRAAAVTWASTAIVIAVAAATMRGVYRLDAGRATVGTMAASYLNAGHLGIPIAVYLVGDAVAVVPTLLFQLFVIAPVAFALLDGARLAEQASVADEGAAPVPRAVRVAAVLRRTVKNPVIVAALAGLLLAALPWGLPDVALEPFRMIGAAAAPMALIAFGMSLAAGRQGGGRLVDRELVLVVVLRNAAHPALAWLLGQALGLDAHAMLTVVTMAALPTAQNVLVYALQYGRDPRLARDAVLVTTLLTAPALITVTLLLR
jgi:predicted permease